MLKNMFVPVHNVMRATTLVHSKSIGNSDLIYIQLKNNILSLFMNINKWKKEKKTLTFYFQNIVPIDLWVCQQQHLVTTFIPYLLLCIACASTCVNYPPNLP
jgi:hypothetical protein